MPMTEKWLEEIFSNLQNLENFDLIRCARDIDQDYEDLKRPA